VVGVVDGARDGGGDAGDVVDVNRVQRHGWRWSASCKTFSALVGHGKAK
jgi:hypothetical protein